MIGDIENKTPNKLKKRIQDIGWFIFAILVFAVIVNISISEFLIKIIPNINYAIGIIILMIILKVIKVEITSDGMIMEIQNFVT